jgi:transposase InsO family protein
MGGEALGAREPGPSMTHHSDRGCPYASTAFKEKLALHGIEFNTSRRGNCYDNAGDAPFRPPYLDLGSDGRGGPR